MAKFVSVLISLIFILMSFLFLNIVPKVIDSHQAQCTESVEAVIADSQPQKILQQRIIVDVFKLSNFFVNDNSQRLP